VKDIPKSMLKSRRARLVHGSGECWYYINPGGLEVLVTSQKDLAASQTFRITRKQMERALEIIKAAE